MADPIKVLNYIIKKKAMEQRRPAGFDKMMDIMKENILQKAYSQEIMLRLRKIIRRESSFTYGFCESISGNFDPIFRYLYAMAFLLLQAVEYISQLESNQAHSFLAASIIATLIFVCAMLINIILYRSKKSSLNLLQALFFYLKCKCSVASRVIDNYD